MTLDPTTNRKTFEKPMKWRHTPKSSYKPSTNLSSSFTQSQSGHHNHRRSLSSFWKDEFLSSTPTFLRAPSGNIQHEPPISLHRQEQGTGSSKREKQQCQQQQPVTYEFYRSMLLVMHRIEELLDEKKYDSNVNDPGSGNSIGTDNNNGDGNHHGHETFHSIRRDSIHRLVTNAAKNAGVIDAATNTPAAVTSPTQFTSIISISNLVDRILETKNQSNDEDQDERQQDPLSTEDIHSYSLPDLMCILYICLQRTRQLVPIEMEEDMLRLKTDEDISTFLSDDTATSSDNNKTDASLKNWGYENDHMQQSFVMNDDSIELSRLTFISVTSHLANLLRIEYHTIATDDRRRDSDVSKRTRGGSVDGNGGSNNTRSMNLLNVLAETFGPLLLCRDINEKSTVWSRHYYLSKERIRRRVIKRIIRHFHSGVITNINTAVDSGYGYGVVDEDKIDNEQHTVPAQLQYQNFSDRSNRAVKVSHITQDNEDIGSIEILVEDNVGHDGGTSSASRVLFQDASDETNSRINEEKYIENNNARTYAPHNRSHHRTEIDSLEDKQDAANSRTNVLAEPVYTDNSFLARILNELGQCCSYPMQEDVARKLSMLVDHEDNLALRMRERLHLADNALRECQSH